MYLFTRRARLSGTRLADSFAWATAITEKVSQATGIAVSLFDQVFSPKVGTLVWATFVPDLKTLETSNDKLMVDHGYLDLVEQGTQFVIPGSVDDSLRLVVHGRQPDPERPVTHVAVVRSIMKAGKLSRGVVLGTEIAQAAEKATGSPTAFLTEATGNYGGVTWISAFASIEDLERAQTALNSSDTLVGLIDSETPGVYTDHPGATTQAIYRRIG
jgi:hypothetical protein